MLLALFIVGGVFFLYLAAYLVWRLGLKNRRKTGPVPILLFHKVEPVQEWGVTSLSPRKFRELLHWLKGSGYESLSPEEALGPEAKNGKKKVLLTFDDGYQGIYAQALPILEECGFTATIFVITDFVGKNNEWDWNLGGRVYKHLNWEEVRELAKRGFSIGSHTVTHPDLTRIPIGRVKYELHKSKEKLEEKLGSAVKLLSYPFGRFTPRVEDVADRAGYEAAFSIYPSRSGHSDGNLGLKRTAIYRMDTPLTLRMKLEGGAWFWLEDFKSYMINRLSLATSMRKTPTQAIEN